MDGYAGSRMLGSAKCPRLPRTPYGQRSENHPSTRSGEYTGGPARAPPLTCPPGSGLPGPVQTSDEGERVIRLHDSLSSGNGYKARLLLAQLGIPFERIEYDIDGAETRTPEFLKKVNPNGRIPVLEPEDER